MPQKNAGDAAPAIGFSGKERQFRAFRPIAGLDRVAAASHHRFRAIVLRGSDQSHNPAEVDLGQLPEVGIRRLLPGTEKAPVDWCSDADVLILFVNVPRLAHGPTPERKSAQVGSQQC